MYPLVRTNTAMENHPFEWENSRKIALFNSYMSPKTRGYITLSTQFVLFESIHSIHADPTARFGNVLMMSSAENKSSGGPKRYPHLVERWSGARSVMDGEIIIFWGFFHHRKHKDMYVYI